MGGAEGEAHKFRTEFDAPEIDGMVWVESSGFPVPDEPFTRIKIIGVRDHHDLTGKMIRESNA